MHNSGPQPNLTALFAEAQSMSRHEEIIVPPTWNSAVFDITHPATATGNALTRLFARLAAGDMKVSERFEGVKAKFVDQTQGIFIQPVASYNDKDPECYKVTWSGDGKRFSIDFAFALIPRKWGTPAGHIRRAPVYMQRNMPNGAGSVLYIDLKNSEVRPKPRRKRKNSSQAPAAEAAAAKQA